MGRSFLGRRGWDNLHWYRLTFILKVPGWERGYMMYVFSLAVHLYALRSGHKTLFSLTSSSYMPRMCASRPSMCAVIGPRSSTSCCSRWSRTNLFLYFYVGGRRTRVRLTMISWHF